MKIYRYQNLSGVGVFMSGLLKLDVRTASNDFDTKSYMTIAYNKGIYRFGYVDGQKYFSDDEIKLFSANNFVLSVFDVNIENILFGKNQVAFNFYESLRIS